MGGGGRTLAGRAMYIYKKTALKKWFTQGLKGKAPRLFSFPLYCLPYGRLPLLAFIRYDALTWGSRHS